MNTRTAKPGADIYSALSVLDNTHTISNALVLGSLTFNSSTYRARRIIFRNVEFTQELRFNEVDFNVGIAFENCIFKEDVTFSNVIASNADPDFYDGAENIFLYKCVFEGQLSVNGKASRIRTLSFLDTTFMDIVGIYDTAISTGGLSFSECKLGYDIDLKNTNIDGLLRIWKTDVKGSVEIENTTTSRLHFQDGTFSDDVEINNCTSGDVHINGGSYLADFDIQASDIASLTFYHSSYAGSVSVKISPHTPHSGFKEITVAESNFQTGLEIITDEEEGGIQQRGTVPSIKLFFGVSMQGSILLENLQIETLHLEGLNANTKVVLDDLSVDTLFINKFINASSLLLLNLNTSIDSPAHFFFMEKSNLGNTQFYNVDLNSFEVVNISNSIVTDITTSGIKWFTPNQLCIELEELKMEQKDLDHNSRREIYRQLKFAMNKQENRIQALEFQKLEMDFYRQHLAQKGKKELGNRLVLWLSMTNDFGLNWLKALAWLLVITGVLFVPIALIGCGTLHCSPALSLNDVKNTLTGFVSQVSVYARLLNPAHDLSRIYPNIANLSGWIHFFDLLFRIVTAFFIFQIITAFRKYSKSQS